MLIAQALGEYGVVAALTESVTSTSIYLEEAVNGNEPTALIAAAIVIWLVIKAVR